MSRNTHFLSLGTPFSPQKEPSKELEITGTETRTKLIYAESAHRHYIPGCIWHITHRCHKQEFLLSFGKDRKRWRHWLFEAKKRYGLCVLDYIVTSNHIHLLVVDTEEDVIAKSLQLVAGRTAQEFNQRKKRKGAFWEDSNNLAYAPRAARLFQGRKGLL